MREWNERIAETSEVQRMGSGIETWVRAFLEGAQQPGGSVWEGMSGVDGHPHHAIAACTLSIRTQPGRPTAAQVATFDLGSGEHQLLATTGAARSPRWSPDGSRLAIVSSINGRTDQAAVAEGDPLAVTATSDLADTVERLDWSPDGGALALVVADAGAEVSDVHGSGVIAGADTQPWQPRVLPGSLGRRRLVVWVPGSEGPPTVPGDANVWEAAWLGSDAFVAIVSDGPGEDDWYGCRLVRIDRSTGASELLFDPSHQIAQPRSAGRGAWSVIAGAASDRDMLVGSIVIGSAAGAPVEVDTAGVHVSDHRWLDESRILFIGLRRQQTVLGVVDADSGSIEELWASDETTGQFQPELGGWSARGPILAVENHLRPPSLGVVRDGSAELVARTSGPGVEHATAHVGRREGLTWASSDGTSIEGYLTLPDRPDAARLPLIVDVHGGPIGAVRNTWAGRDPYVSLLVARGYAVLQVNPRGSTGHGAKFAEAVINDMGGADVDDILSGVQHLVGRGTADPDRLGITGVSYGGYMSAWIPSRTDVFKAAVSRSPCTDWDLMYLTSNIRAFVRIFVDGEPLSPESQYASRSPLRFADRVQTPTLFTAGLRDLACPPSQAHTMYTALVERGIDSELVVYPEEGHDVKGHEALVDQCARLIGWFERFMPASGSSQH